MHSRVVSLRLESNYVIIIIIFNTLDVKIPRVKNKFIIIRKKKKEKLIYRLVSFTKHHCSLPLRTNSACNLVISIRVVSRPAD